MTRSSFRHPRTAVLGFYSTFATASRLVSNYDLSQLGTLYPGGAGRILRLVRVISYYGQGNRCRARAPVRGELEVSVRESATGAFNYRTRELTYQALGNKKNGSVLAGGLLTNVA